MYKATVIPSSTGGWSIWISDASGKDLYYSCHAVRDSWWGTKRKYKKVLKHVAELNEISGLK